MPKHVIVASTPDQAPPCYLLGYRSDWEVNRSLWTLDPWRAAWVDADEAAVEIVLLASLHPECHFHSSPLHAVGTSAPQ